MEVFGWISAVAFAVCGIPQAIRSYRDGHSYGVSHGLLILWMIGELTGLVYAAYLGAVPLLVNYLFNGLFVGIICRYKYYAREKKWRNLEAEALKTLVKHILNFRRFFMK